MRLLSLAISSVLCSSAWAQTGTLPPTGFGGLGGSPLAPVSRSAQLDQRLAALESQAAAIASAIKAVRAEIKQAAEEKKPNEMKMFFLKNAEAKELGRIINEIMPREGTRVVVDGRTNCLIYIGPADRMLVVEALISALDVGVDKKK